MGRDERVSFVPTNLWNASSTRGTALPPTWKLGPTCWLRHYYLVHTKHCQRRVNRKPECRFFHSVRVQNAGLQSVGYSRFILQVKPNRHISRSVGSVQLRNHFLNMFSRVFSHGSRYSFEAFRKLFDR